jgi:hypothetical protein
MQFTSQAALAAPFSGNDGVIKGIYWIAPSVVMFSGFGALVGHMMATARFDSLTCFEI